MPRPSAATALRPAAAAVAAALAAFALFAAPAGAAPAAAAASTAQVPALSRIEFVAALPPPARRPDAGLLVLDLDGLESADAALELARHWRQRTGSTRELICWLRTPSRGLAADALGALASAAPPPCTRILVPR